MAFLFKPEHVLTKEQSVSLWGSSSLRRRAVRRFKKFKRMNSDISVHYVPLSLIAPGPEPTSFPEEFAALEWDLYHHPNAYLKVERCSAITMGDFKDWLIEGFDDEFHFNIYRLDETKSFKDLKRLYAAHVFAPLRAPKHELPFVRKSFLECHSSAGSLSFFSALISRMVKLYPAETLEAVLLDAFTPGWLLPSSLSRASTLKDFTITSSKAKELPAGVVILLKPESVTNPSVNFARAALHQSLLALNVGPEDQYFFTLDASKVPSHLLSKLGGVFMPCDDAVSAVKLLLMTVHSQFETYPLGYNFNSATESVQRGIRANAALALN